MSRKTSACGSPSSSWAAFAISSAIIVVAAGACDFWHVIARAYGDSVEQGVVTTARLTKPLRATQ